MAGVAIVAISYALDRRARLTPPTQAVMDTAIQTWREQPDAWLILSTGDNQRLGITNAHVMAEYAVRQGVLRDKILEEDQSSNTWENLAYSWRLAQTRGVTHLVIVAYDLHINRCRRVAQKQGIPHTLKPATSQTTGQAARKPWFSSRTTILLYEILASVYGRLRNKL
jgi:uncharacterized SAM-binding protein YcdF (DUF218 family)